MFRWADCADAICWQIFGAIGGPLAYYSGARMGATETLPTTHGLLVLIVVWGIMTPLLVWLANYFTRET